jgi:pyrroline-5-carboxylate reductase
MKSKKIAIIGCGNLGISILKGLLDDPDYPSENITATRRNISALSEFKDTGVEITSDNAKAIEQSDIVMVALKPHTILQQLELLKNHFDARKHILVSLATGISISEIKNVVGNDIPIYRAMPNTGADVNESVTCISGPEDGDHLQTLQYFFNRIGTSHIINEELMDAATVLGACGIAYVLRFMRAMVQGGIQIGFDAKTATAIVNQTVKGASQLVIERKQHPEFEIDKVTTPKGCTIAGLNEMEHNGFSSALIKGIVASFERIE